jgi:hypothetical protein
VTFFPTDRTRDFADIGKSRVRVRLFSFGTSIALSSPQIRAEKESMPRRHDLPAIEGNWVRPMKTNIRPLLIGAFFGIATLGLLGCADTENTSPPYTPPATASETSSTTTYSTTTPATQVVDVPTTVQTVPATANSTTTTTRYNDGTVSKRTTTDYSPSYTTYGPPYATTVVQQTPATVVEAPAMTTTRTTSTTTNDDGTVRKETTTTVSPNY